MENYECIGNVKEIAERIFSQEPLPPKTINLQSEGYDGDYSIEDVTRYTHELVMSLTIEGMKVLFGHSNPIELNEDEYILMRQYVNSYGYDMVYSIDYITNRLFVKFLVMN